MKILITSLILTLSFSPLLAQKCDNYDDCLSKGKSDRDGMEYFAKAIKYAKKENKNPSDAYFWRGVKYYNLSKGPEW